MYVNPRAPGPEAGPGAEPETTPTPTPTSAPATVRDLFSLEGRVVLVTGGSSGLGVSLALGCAEAGAAVVLVARTAERLSAVAARLAARGHRCLGVPADVVDPDACQGAVDRAVAELGRVDVLLNNAGVATAYPATREDPAEFRRVVDVNLNGAYWMAQACGRVMPSGSSIVNVSSVLGITTAGLPQAAYSASKAALFGLTRDLAQQWGPRKGIRVNALVPGFFATERTAGEPDRLAGSERLLLGRRGRPEELAATVVWLVSGAGAYVTGQAIVVDGGFSIT
ncbi:MAG TPA: SDR family oxidoreductase [Acidimicrobiales bacterium]|nr:SDR family oxidoreductase [Acidimicrobiales bacterium]